MLLENNDLCFFRQIKGDSYQVWVEKLLNGKGTHMRRTKCVCGVVKSMVVPQGRNNFGWALMKENLEVILIGRSTSNRVNPSNDFDCIISCGNDRVFGKTYKEAVENVIGKVSNNNSRVNSVEPQVTDEVSGFPWGKCGGL